MFAIFFGTSTFTVTNAADVRCSTKYQILCVRKHYLPVNLSPGSSIRSCMQPFEMRALRNADELGFAFE